MESWIRVWTTKDINEIQKHLLIVGDLMGDCAHCRELGIEYKTATKCPNCGTEFKYFTSRRFETHPSERFQIVKRVHMLRSDMLWIDYDDFKKLTGRQQAKDFFLS